jgi:hypothetical protein
VTLNCGGAPATITCSVIPSVTPNGNTPAAIAVAVTTTPRTGGTGGITYHVGIPGGPALPSLVMLTAFAICLLKRRAMLALGAALLLFVLSCGGGGGTSFMGGGGSGGGTTGTPAGTYPMTVTATSGTLVQTVQFSLTVN